MASDGEKILFRSNGQDWLVSWHPTPDPPPGTPHGSAGVCLSEEGDVVLISADGYHWDFPAGRTEPGETWEATLRREVREEACAEVSAARLLGFSRGRCVRGAELDLVLVRAFWKAEVTVLPWEPAFEIRRRLLVPVRELEIQLELEGERLPIPLYRHLLREAGLERPANR